MLMLIRIVPSEMTFFAAPIFRRSHVLGGLIWIDHISSEWVPMTWYQSLRFFWGVHSALMEVDCGKSDFPGGGAPCSEGPMMGML